MLVPIKPVTCDCKSEKFKDWGVDRGAYEVDPITNSTYLFYITITSNALEVDIDRHVMADGDTINDAESKFMTLGIVNITQEHVRVTLYETFDDGRTYDKISRTIPPRDSLHLTIPVTRANNVILYTVTAGTYTMNINDNRERADFKLSDIIESDLIGDTEDEFLNTYYANWCIVDPFDDFESELKVAFMLAEDKLTAYKAQLTDFNPGAHTVMSVDYGERGNTEYGYRYPIGGNVNTSAPNTGAKATVDAVTDTTTVDKNEEPFKNLDKTKAMDGWLKFFVDQFKDCFTLCEAMTW